MSTENAVTLTDSLVARIKTLRDRQGDPNLMLRVAVNGGGCQGFEYVFSFDHGRADDDRMFEKDGVTVLIDEMSLELLAGATIDFTDDLTGAAFKIKNPNAKSSCGCGTSFSL